jgi:hypothetical protein
MLPLGLDFFENSYRPMPRQSFRRVLHLIQLEIFPPIFRTAGTRTSSHAVLFRIRRDMRVLAQSLNRA